MADLERCEVTGPDGTKLAMDLIVVRRIPLRIDCSCWRHQTRLFTVLVTHGGAFVRADGNEGFYRAMDVAGPLVVAIPSPT